MAPGLRFTASSTKAPMSTQASTLGASNLRSSRPAKASTHASARATLRTDLLIYATIAALTAAAWWISAQGWFTSWSRTGYWIGVAGGVSMLLLFSYPLRKRWRVTYNWGAARHWFVLHMVLGVMGPWLILVHSTFKIGSTNAAVALFSMVIVALSGVIGRFLYVRLHADLRGEKASLSGLRRQLNEQHQSTDATLPQVPQVLAALHDFEDTALPESGASPGHLWRLFVLPVRRRRLSAACRHDIKLSVKAVAKAQGWSPREALERFRLARNQVDDYLMSVQRAAQFQSFERLFSMWHVAHVPFVWIMVVCALFHIVAVHAY
jgi:hypothetical protein